ncbi:transmembrane protein 71 isoform X1 [Eleutherodactylus coqui]|uniref:transmembrane protein 71 isoform X1 n=1 Tax=Eleutherodactylus coqui TaxID=57060 RepID=UPI0034634F82
MNSDFFNMAAQPPRMSTPIKGKYSSLFQEIARLPYRLFGRCSGETSRKMNSVSPNPCDINMSPCRHSLRLISNGYYICDEDSFCWDDLGNISFSPSQCTVSYKENMVRIFRKRRRTATQRRLDLTNHGPLEDWQPPHYEEFNDTEPPAIEQIHRSISEDPSLCDAGSTNLYAEAPLETAESDTDPAPPGCSQHTNNGSPDPMSSIRRFTDLEDSNKADHQPGHYSWGGYLFVKNVVNTHQFSDDIISWGPTERQLVQKHSSDSIATTLTPTIESVSTDMGDPAQKKTPLILVLIPLLLLGLIFWWARSPDHNGIL